MNLKATISSIPSYQDDLCLSSILIELVITPMTVLMMFDPKFFYNSPFRGYTSLETPTDRFPTILFQFLQPVAPLETACVCPEQFLGHPCS